MMPVVAIKKFRPEKKKALLKANCNQFRLKALASVLSGYPSQSCDFGVGASTQEEDH